MRRMLMSVILCIMTFLLLSCGPSDTRVELFRFSLDDIEQTLAGDLAVTDTTVKAEGSASLRIDADKAMVVNLLELDNVDIENATLIYEASLRSRGLGDGAYLEMWCVFSGLGEYFSRGLQAPISGDADWTTVSTPFFLQSGQNPDLVRLNLVMAGPGTVWIDDIRLLSAELP